MKQLGNLKEMLEEEETIAERPFNKDEFEAMVVTLKNFFLRMYEIHEMQKAKEDL